MPDAAPETSSTREPAVAERESSREGAACRTPLRMAVLVDGYEQPAWVTSMLRQILDAGVAEISLVVVNAAEAESQAVVKRSAAGRVANWWRKRDVLPYAAYRRFDRRRYLQP